MPEDDPLATNACRTELFGRIVAGDLDGARAGLTRAERAGLPPAECELFAGWTATRRGRDAATQPAGSRHPAAERDSRSASPCS